MKNNYRIVDSCMTCKHRIEISEQDDGMYYYCNVDKKYKQDYYPGLTPMNKTLWKEAREWCGTYTVDENGICDDFEKEVSE